MNGDAILAEILNNPDEDAPRLVYADWLEEQGQDARAAWIRVQVERSRLDPSDPRHLELARQEAGLFPREDHVAWVEDFPLEMTFSYGRGFIEYVEVSTPRLWKSMRKVLSRHPIRHLVVHGQDACEGMTPSKLSLMGRVESLSIHGGVIDFDALAEADLPRLTCLDLRSTDGLDAVRALHSAKWVASLQSLRIEASGLTDIGAWFLSNVELPSLNALYLPDNEELGNVGVARIASMESAPSLQILDLSRTGLTGAGARRMAANPLLGRLTHLGVACNRLASGAVALATSPHLEKLESLDLKDVMLERRGFEQFARSASLHGLSCLRVSGSGVGPLVVRLLMENKALSQLSELEISTSPSGQEVAGLLASDHNSWQLSALDLGHCRLGDEGVQDLASPRLSSLRELNLTGNELSDDGAARLAEAECFRNLRHLELSHNRITSAGGEALARSRALTLLHLGLEGNEIGEEAAQLLRDRYGSGVEM